MADFVNQLRLNNTFSAPDTNSWNPDEARGMINMIYPLIKQSKDEEMLRQQNMMRFQKGLSQEKPPVDFFTGFDRNVFGNNGQVGNIASSAVGGGVNYRTALGPGEMTDYQKAQVELGHEGLQQKGQVAGAKDVNADEDRAIKQQRADTYTSMHDLSDAEKLDIINRARRGDIEARGIIQRDLLDTRGEQQTSQIKERGDIQKDLTATRGNQNLADIAARGAQTRQTNAAKPVTSSASLPTQQRAAINNKARQLATQYPDLAKWITFDTNGNFTVNSDADEVSKANIGRILYGSNNMQFNQPQSPVNLQPATPKATTPTTTTPKAAAPSKYKVTIQ